MDVVVVVVVTVNVNEYAIFNVRTKLNFNLPLSCKPRVPVAMT